MFFAQVPHTTTSFTWRIIGFKRLLISITNVVFLIFKWWRIILFFIRYTIPFCPFTWIVWFLNTFFSFDQIFVSLFLLFLRGIRCFPGNSVVTIAPGSDTIERLVLYFLTSIYFGCSMFLPLSEELADEIYLYLFIIFTVSSISII